MSDRSAEASSRQRQRVGDHHGLRGVPATNNLALVHQTRHFVEARNPADSGAAALSAWLPVVERSVLGPERVHRGVWQARVMPELWQLAVERQAEFDAGALDCDRYRPRYPGLLFDDVLSLGGLRRGLPAVEVGVGTGIATLPLVDGGLKVIALEPAPAMAEVARAKLGSRARVEVSRFEDWTASDTVHLIAAFNAWHWIEPNAGIAKVTELLAPGGALAIVWTEVIAWGSQLFEGRLADAFGALWPKTIEQFGTYLGPDH